MDFIIVTKVETFSDGLLCCQHHPAVFKSKVDARKYIINDIKNQSIIEHREFRLLYQSFKHDIFSFYLFDADVDFDTVRDDSTFRKGIVEYKIWFNTLTL